MRSIDGRRPSILRRIAEWRERRREERRALLDRELEYHIVRLFGARPQRGDE